MKRLLVIALAMFFVVGCSKKEEGKNDQVDNKKPRVVMETDMGTVVLELFPDVAPNHVKNFLDLVNKGFYNGLIFHRVVKDFVIQSGDPKGDGTGGAGYTIPAEFSDLKHMPGTVGMARGPDVNSASSQFYICLAQLPGLDNNYTIFGQVVKGMDVVKKIGLVETVKEKPVTPVYIMRMWEEGKTPPPPVKKGEEKPAEESGK